MPNGGSDCCGCCAYNRAIQEAWRGQTDHRERLAEHSYCILRNVKIAIPFWTYCHNFAGWRVASFVPTEEPVGPVYANGLYEGYVRIPWHGAIEPQAEVPCTCSVCGRVTDCGISLPLAEGTLGFCTNRHYVEWWNSRHPESPIDSSQFETPEEHYKGEYWDP